MGRTGGGGGGGVDTKINALKCGVEAVEGSGAPAVRGSCTPPPDWVLHPPRARAGQRRFTPPGPTQTHPALPKRPPPNSLDAPQLRFPGGARSRWHPALPVCPAEAAAPVEREKPNIQRGLYSCPPPVLLPLAAKSQA